MLFSFLTRINYTPYNEKDIKFLGDDIMNKLMSKIGYGLNDWLNTKSSMFVLGSGIGWLIGINVYKYIVCG